MITDAYIQEEKLSQMKRILVDVNRCSGCRLCEMACSFFHEKKFSSSLSRIRVMKEDIFGFDLPIVCWHCEPCVAMENCPAEAFERNGQGLISVNKEKCTGCGKCLETCIIEAITLLSKTKKPLICDQCGGAPVCVEKCPTKALTYIATDRKQPELPNQILEETLRRWRMIA